MKGSTTGTVVSVKKQWWLKVNTKPVRRHAFDGAKFPHIIKVEYSVNGITYFKHKWIGALEHCPMEGAKLNVHFDPDKPKKCRIVL